MAHEQRHEFNARARREFELLEGLEHQSIVRVYEHGFHEGVAYYVMELLDGVPLASYLTEQPRTYGEIAFILQRLASALSHAHRLGVVHRDLKPGNVLVERQLRRVEDSEDGTQLTEEDRAGAADFLRDEMAELLERVEERLESALPPVRAEAEVEGAEPEAKDDVPSLEAAADEEGEEGGEEEPGDRARELVVEAIAELRDQTERRPAHLPEVGRVPVLIDFGIGHEVGVDAVTAPGVLMGTVEFLPPNYAAELLSGRRVRHQAEPHEDIYQAGVLLYAMLTGRLPTKTPAAQVLALLVEIRDEKPAHVREVNPEAPPALAELAMLCLEKRSQRRPADGSALLWRVNAAMNEDQAYLARTAPAFQAHETPGTETELVLADVNAEPALGDVFGAPEGAGVAHLRIELEPTPEREGPAAPEPVVPAASPAPSPQVPAAATTPAPAASGPSPDSRREHARRPAWHREVATRLLARGNLELRRRLRAALLVTGLALLGCVGMGIRWHLAAERAEERAARLDEREEKLEQALSNAAQAEAMRAWTQAQEVALGMPPVSTAVPPPTVAALTTSLFQGLKMPQKPDPKWLKPGADGECRNPKTGELLGLVVVLRGTCWQPGAKVDKNKSCPKRFFDPPPEVMKDPELQDLRDKCFTPYQIDDLQQSETPIKR